jgi:predicted DNA binding CopG/RHH family protein
MKKDSMTKALSAEELDAKFDSGEDFTEHLDPSSVTRPGLEIKRVNVDLPNHFLEKLDQEAALRGITRQSLIKAWLYDRLERR